jgi:ribosomal protein L34E
MKYCKKCGWMLEYIPRSFQEQIKEVIDGQERKGYWRCPSCGFKMGGIEDINGRNEKKETVS